MDRKLLIAAILVFVVVSSILYNFYGKLKELKEEDLVKVSYGNVQVTAMYLNPKYPELTKPTFYFRLDTHSGDLYIYDIANGTTLEVNGKNFAPVSWKEDEKSWGHHRIGILEFPEEALEEIKRSGKFRLVVKLESERVLEWEI